MPTVVYLFTYLFIYCPVVLAIHIRFVVDERGVGRHRRRFVQNGHRLAEVEGGDESRQ